MLERLQLLRTGLRITELVDGLVQGVGGLRNGADGHVHDLERLLTRLARRGGAVGVDLGVGVGIQLVSHLVSLPLGSGSYYF